MTDHDHIDALKAAADPLRVAVALGLHGRGSRFFCPLCQPQGGKTPDLSVRDKGFTCHKCGEKGDVLKLIMVALDMDFPSAVAWLEREKARVGTRAGGRSFNLGDPVKPSTLIRSRPRVPPPIPPSMKPSCLAVALWTVAPWNG